MQQLSFIELMALLFTGIAGMASAAQAYVSWETRGEVSRAIIFAQRIDACNQVLAAIDPFVSKAREDGRKLVAGDSANGRYSLPQYYYRLSSGNAAFEAKHGPRVEKWRVAAAAIRIVAPQTTEGQIEFFDKVITKEIPEGRYLTQAQFLLWLKVLENKSNELAEGCRGVLQHKQ